MGKYRLGTIGVAVVRGGGFGLSPPLLLSGRAYVVVYKVCCECELSVWLFGWACALLDVG